MLLSFSSIQTTILLSLLYFQALKCKFYGSAHLNISVLAHSDVRLGFLRHGLGLEVT